MLKKIRKKNFNLIIINKLKLNKYCKNLFIFFKLIKNIYLIKYGFNYLKKKLIYLYKRIKRKGKMYWKKIFFFSDLYNIYFFWLKGKRRIHGKYLKLKKKLFFFLDVKGSLNNLFINLFLIKNGKKILIYYISSGLKFKNCAKSLIFSSIRLSDIIMGFVNYKKIKNIIVVLYGLEYKVLKFFKLFGSYNNKKKYNILYFFVKKKIVFNGVRNTKKRRN